MSADLDSGRGQLVQVAAMDGTGTPSLSGRIRRGSRVPVYYAWRFT